MRTVYVQVQPSQRYSNRVKLQRRWAHIRVQRMRDRLQDLENKGLITVVRVKANRAIYKARAAARAAGLPWTREDDRNFRSPKRKKTKALDDKV